MVKNKLLHFLQAGFLSLCVSYSVNAAGNKSVTDTVPPANKNVEQPLSKKDEELIKEVPKARKQEKPIAVTPVVVTPVLVKPKIIVKPIIKIH